MTQADNVGDKAAPFPGQLYHYTTFSKFIDIFRSKSIWSTDLRYLNDKNEYRDAIKTMTQIAIEFSSAETKSKYAASGVWEHIENFIGRIIISANNPSDWTNWQVYTVSFSEDGDDLSQWRAYARPSGVAVGLDRKSLVDIAHLQNFWLEKCIYREKEKKKIIRHLIEKNVDILSSFKEVNQSPFDFADSLYKSMMWEFAKFACVFKDDAFESEKEWRLIGQTDGNVGELLFHATGTLIIPHRPISFVPEKAERRSRVKVSEVVIGPSNEPGLNGLAALRLVLNAGFGAPGIRQTRAPYREIL